MIVSRFVTPPPSVCLLRFSDLFYHSAGENQSDTEKNNSSLILILTIGALFKAITVMSNRTTHDNNCVHFYTCQQAHCTLLISFICIALSFPSSVAMAR